MVYKYRTRITASASSQTDECLEAELTELLFPEIFVELVVGADVVLVVPEALVELGDAVVEAALVVVLDGGVGGCEGPEGDPVVDVDAADETPTVMVASRPFEYEEPRLVTESIP